MCSDTNDKKRSILVDMIKGIAIILVCYGHCIQYGSGLEISQSRDFFNNNVYKLIYSFHMPLFCIVSGYLFKKSVCKIPDLKVFLRTKVLALIVPMIAWNSIRVIVSILIGRSQLSYELLLKWINLILKVYWFPWAIFFCALLVWFIHKYLKDNNFIYFAMFVAMMFIPDFSGGGYRAL